MIIRNDAKASISDKKLSRSKQPRRIAVEFLTLYSIACALSGFPLSSMVGTSGLEPPTSRLSGARSNHLSYAPLWLTVFSFSLAFGLNRFSRPATWWRWRESNPWPPACRAGALPAELHPHYLGIQFSFGHWKLNNDSRNPCCTRSVLSSFL